MDTAEPSWMLQMHLVKLGASKDVRDPQGHARVRTSTGGDVLHRQNAGDPVPTASQMELIMLKMRIASTANLKVHSHDTTVV